MATNEQLRLVIDVAAKQAVKELNSLTKATENAADAQTDLRTNAERVNDGLKAASAVMLADMQQSEAAAKALGDALGPELAAKLGDAKLDSFIADLKRAGLTFQEVEQNADMFASTLRDMDAASGKVQNVDKAMVRLDHSSEQSRSVLANMVGNSAQDLGELAGIAGSAGVMIGQLAEYATDGNISLSGLAKTAGPLIAVGVGVQALSSVMEENAKQQQFLRDQTAALIDILKHARDEGTTVVSGMVADWEQSGKIEAQISNMTATMVEFGQATDDMGKIHDLQYPTAQKRVVDFAAEIDKLGMRAEDFAKLVEAPIETVQEWGRQMVAAGADAGQVNLVMQGAVALHTRLSDAQKADAVSARVFSDAMSISGSMMGEAARQGHKLADAIHRVNVEGLAFGSINGSMAGEAARGGGRQVDMYAKYIADQAKKGGSAAKAAVKKTAEELAREMDQLNAKKFDFGFMSEADYRKYLDGRLKAVKKFSDDYFDILSRIRTLDDAAAKRKKEAADQKKKLDEEAKRAAEERKRAEDAAQQAEMDASQRSIAAANVAGASYQYITTAADPYAVINAIKQWERNNGTGWRS